MQVLGDATVSSSDMAAYMRHYRERAGGERMLDLKRELKRTRPRRPVASHRPLPVSDQRPGHCLFCGHRTVAVDDVCSVCRQEIEA